MYAIEKNVPLPVEFQPKPTYPFKEMAARDSFMVPATNGDVKKLTKRCYVAASYANRTMTGKRFAVRQVEGGVRVWRVK